MDPEKKKKTLHLEAYLPSPNSPNSNSIKEFGKQNSGEAYFSLTWIWLLITSLLSSCYFLTIMLPIRMSNARTVPVLAHIFLVIIFPLLKVIKHYCKIIMSFAPPKVPYITSFHISLAVGTISLCLNHFFHLLIFKLPLPTIFLPSNINLVYYWFPWNLILLAWWSNLNNTN